MNYLIILLLILTNGLFAMTEMAIVSVRRTHLKSRAEGGDLKAQAVLSLLDNPNRFLSTVQIGITLVGVLSGAFGGIAIAEELAAILKLVPWLEPHSANIAFGIVVLTTTYLTLVFGELVPKHLALNKSETIAMLVAPPMRVLAQLTAPIVYLLTLSTETVVRILGIPIADDPPITEEEIRSMLRQGTQAGVFEEAEENIVHNVFRLDDLRVNALMTPRTEIIWLNLNDTAVENLQKIAESPYSRFLVCDGELDKLKGVVSAKHLLTHKMDDETLRQKEMLRNPLFIPETLPALRLVELFKSSETDIAVIIDEYGSPQGIVTLSDVLEAIVGDILSANDMDPKIIQRDDGSWLLDGMLLIDDFKDFFGVKKLPDEDRGDFQTLAGFIIDWLDRIPQETDSFEWNALRFEVIDMDGFRIDKVLITPLKASAEPGTPPTESHAGTR